MKNLFKKVIATVAIMTMVVGIFPATAHANTPDITITLNGRTLAQNNDIGFAEIRDGRTLVPLRLVTEAMGFQVDYRSADQLITLTNSNQTVYHRVGTLQAWDTPTPDLATTRPLATTDVPSFISPQNRTMVGLRLLVEAFPGTTIEWVGSTRTVVITTTWDTTPPEFATAEDFYDIIERHADGTITVRTDAGHLVRIQLTDGTNFDSNLLNPNGNFDGDRTGFRINLDTRTDSFGRQITDPNMSDGDIVSGSGIDAIRVGTRSTTTGGGIVEITQPDGTSLGRFMVGDGGRIGITGLAPGSYRITLIQPPAGFTSNQFNSNARPVDANGNPVIDINVSEGRNTTPGFTLMPD